jgi:hypothetical protein
MSEQAGKTDAKTDAKTGEGNSNMTVAIRNKAIDEYYKLALQGVISADAGNRQPEFLVKAAMDIAIAAYARRCDTLGVTFCKAT